MVDLNSLDAYDFVLPNNRIAKFPCEPRDASRLLVLHRRTRVLEHKKFQDLPDYLNSEDLLVANNAKVLKCRFLGNRLFQEREKIRLGGKVEFMLLEETGFLQWKGLYRCSAKQKLGVSFLISTPDGLGLFGKIIYISTDRSQSIVTAKFNRDPLTSGAGEMPLPPYLHRKSCEKDETTYQTSYAKCPGAVAAPTAGLHFTPTLLSKLISQGVGWAEITLHVGLGTFRPVKEKDLRAHLMHEERYEICDRVAKEVTQAKQEGKRIVSVGTTSVRSLESAWSVPGGTAPRENKSKTRGGYVKSGVGLTSLFLYPGHAHFQVVDCLITNFHLPRSTLFMLICAFAGKDLALEAYKEAIRKKYRFYSYGDAMLIL